MKDKMVLIRMSEEQDKILQAKMQAAGFGTKADYIRFVLFMETNLKDMIKQIYEKVIKDD